MNTNVKTIYIIISSLLIGAVTTYSWNNQTLSEMVEEHNQQILSDCLTKARIQKTAKEILEYASNCNKDILTNISTPRSVETITGTHSTGNTVPPLGFQLIPTAEAKSVESASKELQIKNTKASTTHSTIGDTNTGNVRTPKQINSKTLIDAGISSNLAKEIVNVCNSMARDPLHCMKYASSVSSAESGGGKKCYNNNCFGIKAGTIGFKTLNDGVIDWVTRYNKYWRKATSMSQFYAPKGKLPYFRYCTSEISSNSKVGCPFGLKHSSSTFNKLNKIF